MSDIRVTSVCGSLQARSSNLRLLETFATLAPPGVVVERFDGVRALPLFDLDRNEGEPPAPVRAWRDTLRSCDAVLIATPEYGHSLPGALKNAIDWVFGSGELYQKPVVITAASAGPGRGLRGLAALRQTLCALDAHVLVADPIPRGAEGEPAARVVLGDLADTVRRVRAGEPALLDVPLPVHIEELVRGTLLREPLMARSRAAQGDAAGADELVANALAELLAERVPLTPPGGATLVLARAEALLATEHEALASSLLADVLVRVDETPALPLVLEQLGPLARAHLGL